MAIVSGARSLDRCINYRVVAKVNIHKLHAAKSDRTDDFAADDGGGNVGNGSEWTRVARRTITRGLIRTGNTVLYLPSNKC